LTAELLPFERAFLWGIVGISILAFIYAALLARQVLREKLGTGKMLDVWKGIRDGANAYLRTQFRSIIVVIGGLGIVLYLSAALADAPLSISIGRAGAFLMGAFFSAMVGYLGMNMAV